jgi:hypothetical protein
VLLVITLAKHVKITQAHALVVNQIPVHYMEETALPVALRVHIKVQVFVKFVILVAKAVLAQLKIAFLVLMESSFTTQLAMILVRSM